MERTMTVYATENARGNESNIKEKIITILSSIKSIAVGVLSRLRQEKNASHLSANFDIGRQLEKERANMGNYMNMQILR